MANDIGNNRNRAVWRRRARRGLAAAVAGATIGVATLTVAPTTGGAADCAPASSVVSELEARLGSRLNDLRRSNRLPALTVNASLSGQSREWSAVMGDAGTLYHARDTGADDGVLPEQDYAHLMDRSVPDWTVAAENVGVSPMVAWCSEADLRSAAIAAADALHDAFAVSTDHADNMLGDYDQVGIGVQVVADQIWVTARFAETGYPGPSAGRTGTLSDPELFIDAVYDLFLGRPASRADLDRWRATVAGGDRGRLTAALAASNEWAGARVGDLYRTVLGREPDAGGQQGWVSGIARGMRLEDVAAGFYGSPERFNAAGRSVTGYVEGLYRDILSRPADQAGLRDWVNRIERGAMSRTDVAAGFYGSLESRTTRVRSLYDEVLDRAPDAAGQAHWVRKLSTMGDVVLASNLASSTEFWQRSTR